QQHLLPVATARAGRAVAGPGAAGVLLRGEGRPLRDPPQEAARRGSVARPPPRARRAARGRPRSEPRAAAAELATRRGPARLVPRGRAAPRALGGGGAPRVVAARRGARRAGPARGRALRPRSAARPSLGAHDRLGVRPLP